MYDNLIAHINSQLATPMSEAEIQLLKETFKPKKLRKHQFFLQEGEVCKLAGFITKGALKQYTIDETGKESILALCIENWWAGDRESFSKNAPTSYFIDACEDTELLVVTKDVFLEKLSNQRFMTEFMRSVTERNAFQLLKRVHATKTMTAEQRLADLESTYPEFLQRFPQHIIASYLGMTKETMSRIRSKPVNK